MRVLRVCFIAVSLGCVALPAVSAQQGLAAGPAVAGNPGIPAGISEVAVSFPTVDGLTLPGILTLPTVMKGAPKPPIAVLVQGSGVQDRDATIGPNKFFQQVAWGLAARGVASLRYDRRAKVDPANFMQHADLDHEVVLDAAAAMGFVQTLPQVDAASVFYAGHSLGAEVGPDCVALRLKQKAGSVRGMVLLSGVARPIDQVMNQQIAVLGKAQGGTPEQIDAYLKLWADVWLQARDPATPGDRRIGVGTQLPTSYWRDWIKRDPVATMKGLEAKGVALPVLVIRGTKDVNAPHEDFVMLKAAATSAGSAAQEFPGLNHIYMPITGEPNGADVMTAGTVAPEVLEYVAAWIRKTAGRS